MGELLAPEGVLVCLEFPNFKDPREPGPPWPVVGVYADILAEGGDGILYRKYGGGGGGGGKERCGA